MKQIIHQITVAAAVMLLACGLSSAESLCTLEHMRQYASEACEHLNTYLRQPVVGNRIKRSINDNHIEDYCENERLTEVRRSDFPDDGFLVMKHCFFQHLKKSEIKYTTYSRYVKHKNMRDKGEKKRNYRPSGPNQIDRRKRDRISTVLPIHFCCQNSHNCNRDYFCTFD